MTVPAYEHNGVRVSRGHFYAVACDPRRSVAVEACAGAGKTWMLVSRIVRALLAGARPHEILAITFTRKAAGEMRKRLHDWLKEWAGADDARLARELALRGVPDADAAACEALRRLYPALLASGQTVQVRTFHSWFAALLGAAPIAVPEALGLPARYELLQDDAEAVARVWRRFHIAVAREPQLRRDYEESVASYGRSQTLKALAAALAKRVEFAMADDHGAVEHAVQPMAAQFPRFAGAAAAAHLLGSPQVQAPLLEAARALGRASAATVSAKGAQLEQAVAARDLDAALSALLTQENEPRKFGDKLAGIDAVRRAQDLALQLCAARCQHEAWLHHGRMTRLARLLLREFAALKREHGWIDMNDVERAALALLRDPVLAGWTQERLDARVRHLLIDEFQDTNPLQWQALGQWLESYAGAGAGAPSVFLVGDPKQSIYRFRRAEPKVFDAAQAFITEQLGGDRLSCDHTHRNAPAVLEVVNRVLVEAQQQGEFAGFRAHTTESADAGGVFALPQVPRAPKAERAPAQPLAWRDSLTTARETPEERLATLECRQAAAWIAAQIAQGTPAGDIMVLARRRDRLGEMEQALRQLHIPAQQPEKTDLCELPEAQDVTALLDALVSTSHDLSLARALKSPIFAAGDEGLLALGILARQAQQQGSPASWFELLMRARDLPPSLMKAREQLARWKGWVDELPPHDALEAIYHHGDLLARYAASAPAPLRDGMLANLRALLGAALDVQGGRYLTPYALVRALKSTRIPGPAVAAAGVVRLLTVHGAKGLEAPVVLVLDTDGAPPPAETMGVLCEWPPGAPAPWRFAFVASEARPPPCSLDALRAEQEARHREELNTLYVALTRAGRRLVISSMEPHRRGAASWWERLAPYAVPLAAPAAPAASGPEAQAPVALAVLPRVALPALAQAADPDDSAQARFGRAVHRLLEFALQAGGGFAPARLRRAAREFALGEAETHRAADTARRILSGEGAWAWDAQAVDWQGNEVELHHRGELLRIDRLVRRSGSGEWWVLDYKSAARPQLQPELVAQMARYREAVQAAHPGATVRAAFLTGQGRLVPLDLPAAGS